MLINLCSILESNQVTDGYNNIYVDVRLIHIMIFTSIALIKMLEED